MKKLYVLIVGLLLCSTGFGQSILRTAGETSGIVKSDSSGFSVGFEFTKTEVQFNYSQKREISRNFLLMNDGRRLEINKDLDLSSFRIADVKDTIPVSEYKAHNYRFNTPVEENANAIFSDGKFNPGIGLLYEYIGSKNQFDSIAKYKFLRFSYEVKRNSFGLVDATDTIRVDKRTSHSFGITPGYNFIFSDRKHRNMDNVVLALSLPIKYSINPVDDLKSREFITDYRATKNGVVQKTENAYKGEQEDYISITPKFDFAYTPFIKRGSDGNEVGARFGFLGSFSPRINLMEGKVKYNLSAGPSLHPKWSTSTVLATVQAEFLDFTDSAGDRDFDDIFAIKFFVGIPLLFK